MSIRFNLDPNKTDAAFAKQVDDAFDIARKQKGDEQIKAVEQLGFELRWLVRETTEENADLVHSTVSACGNNAFFTEPGARDAFLLAFEPALSQPIPGEEELLRGSSRK